MPCSQKVMNFNKKINRQGKWALMMQRVRFQIFIFHFPHFQMHLCAILGKVKNLQHKNNLSEKLGGASNQASRKICISALRENFYSSG